MYIFTFDDDCIFFAATNKQQQNSVNYKLKNRLFITNAENSQNFKLGFN